MSEPIVFVRKMEVARAVLTDPDVYALAAKQIMMSMESDIQLRAEGRRYTVTRSKIVIGDSLDTFIRNMLEAEMQITVVFTE